MGPVTDRIRTVAGDSPPPMGRVDMRAADLNRVTGRHGSAEELSPINGVALVVVDLRSGAWPDVSAIAIESLPCVVVARTSATTSGAEAALAACCDVVLGDPVSTGPGFTAVSAVSAADGIRAVVADEAQVDELFATILANPLAAVSLALLLRSQSGRTIEDGLVAESTTYSLLQSGPEFARWLTSRPTRAPRVQQGPSVRIERDDDILRLTISRPQVHNAFDRSVRDGLTEGLELALADPSIRRVVLSGDGPSFSSGGDLDEFGSFADPVSSHLTRLTRSPARLVARLKALGTRVEVHLHGACMGAGIELPAFATHIVADPDSRLALPELRYGLIPGAGGTVSVTRRIGRHRSAYLGLSGRTIDAATALRWGLVDRIEPRP